MFEILHNRKITLNKKAPIGFTLMELLLVIAIMGVLTTMALAMLRSANESARVSATQARISRIEAILNSELERYEVRRLPISRDILVQFINANSWTPAVPLNVRIISLQKRIVQDLIKAEMPSPVLNGTVFEINPDLGKFPTETPPQGARLGLWDWLGNRYGNPGPGLREFLRTTQLPSASIATWQDSNFQRVNSAGVKQFNHPGEYLYEILTRIDLDGVPALETLGSTSFADSDNDGYLEVVDAWGEPLLWFIAQIAVTNPGANDERFDDVSPIDWTKRDANGMPEGYTPLDSTIPRDLQQIRLTVFSKRMNDQGIYNTN